MRARTFTPSCKSLAIARIAEIATAGENDYL